MGYTRLSLLKNDNVRKYILFYADYLNEAWLSEVLEDDTTKIIKQFKCKNLHDVDALAEYISKRGDVVKLTSGETTEEYLQILENRLVEKPKRIYSRTPQLRLAFASYRLMWNRLTGWDAGLRMAS
jgi:hypothetical protein